MGLFLRQVIRLGKNALKVEDEYLKNAEAVELWIAWPVTPERSQIWRLASSRRMHADFHAKTLERS
jgi:hypothetical protein